MSQGGFSCPLSPFDIPVLTTLIQAEPQSRDWEEASQRHLVKSRFWSSEIFNEDLHVYIEHLLAFSPFIRLYSFDVLLFCIFSSNISSLFTVSCCHDVTMLCYFLIMSLISCLVKFIKQSIPCKKACCIHTSLESCRRKKGLYSFTERNYM